MLFCVCALLMSRTSIMQDLGILEYSVDPVRGDSVQGKLRPYAGMQACG